MQYCSLQHWNYFLMLKQCSVVDVQVVKVKFNAAVVHLVSSVQLFETPWTAAHQATLSFTISRSLLKLMSMELVMPSSAISSSAAPFSSCLQSFPALGSFPLSQLFSSGGQSIGASASASVLPMNIQGWFPLGLTGLISLESKGLVRQGYLPLGEVRES